MASTFVQGMGGELTAKGIMWVPAIIGGIVAGPIAALVGLGASIVFANRVLEKMSEKERREQEKQAQS
jgi:hypothetical protein